MAQVFDDNLITWLIIHSFNNHKTTKKAGGALMYEYLVRKKIITYSAEQVRENYKQAFNNNRHYLTLIPAEQLKKSAIVINEAKALCVDDFFIDLKINGGTIEPFFIDIPFIVLNP